MPLRFRGGTPVVDVGELRINDRRAATSGTDE
jgi:hypothetical protein